MEFLTPSWIKIELKDLSSGDVHFVCKTCSTRLTRQPFRCFVELPSVNWREAADNWFGNCCCSFGGVSEKLVSKYVKSYACIQGTCLVDTASVIVCKDDLEGFLSPRGLDQQPLRYNSYFSPTSPCVAQRVTTNSCKREDHTNSLTCPLFPSTDCTHDMIAGNGPLLVDNFKMARLSLNETHSIHLDISKSNLGCENLEKSASDPAGGILKDNCHCSIEETDYLVPAMNQESNSVPEMLRKGLDNCYLGSGFISRTSNLSDDVEWVNFSCRQCSSIIGSYPSSKTANDPLDDGVRLFKCYISTDVPAGRPHDIFRKYTLETIFVSLLLEGAKDELSFRIVLRDLKTKAPMLQVVILNSESWCSTGDCMENGSMGTLPEIDVQPVVKVLFSDCTTSTEASSRIKDWLTRTHTEEVYTMGFQIEELTNYLKSAADRLPASCSSLQGMALSYLQR